MGDDRPHPLIELTRVSYRYPDGTEALRQVGLAVREGRSLALLGPNGAGKSTLLLHLNGILRATEGSVSVHGRQVTDATVREVRRDVGLVFQDPDDQLFMTTLYEDIAFGPLNMGMPHHEVDSRVHEALHEIGLAEAASRPGHHLSFGQRKRAALATVLVMEPRILVLDEPTANLDPRSRRQMIELVKSLGTTALIATHDMDVAWELCADAAVLDAGMVIASGSREDILTDEALLHEHGLELPWAVRTARA
ncbi:MAG: ATP-binding cassette domain-containing protein [Coriobacteriia bacterium]|nr:ATP-binding cassette domain-containing protein [Coriobacteriia bacterium]